jgi:hypothetical protein
MPASTTVSPENEAAVAMRFRVNQPLFDTVQELFNDALERHLHDLDIPTLPSLKIRSVVSGESYFHLRDFVVEEAHFNSNETRFKIEDGGIGFKVSDLTLRVRSSYIVTKGLINLLISRPGAKGWIS